MSQTEREYLLGRADSERTLAERTPNKIARDIHLRLAHEYELRANILEIESQVANDRAALASDQERSV